MGKSSPTKLQLKHIPNHLLIKLMYQFQELDETNTVHFDDLKFWLSPIPEKLLLRKLQQMENRGWIESYGPACRLFRAVVR
ncbi:hypothetical protein QCN36_gp88 [Arthrobacter phage CastorTray]|uniref:Uncharacterized protein n=1 Tax=Arthrobacter phage CastorTray TaxID=2859632 RepID=A0AAE7WDI3_9CAUD|nr:hypothetical protein QCN36_gp88 [Arthrobacter phage CastorTray]QYC55070.1 hypothetical protein SEA_CASTORTRAY_88 [Arthrobacter phage CastorTray]